MGYFFADVVPMEAHEESGDFMVRIALVSQCCFDGSFCFIS